MPIKKTWTLLTLAVAGVLGAGTVWTVHARSSPHVAFVAAHPPEPPPAAKEDGISVYFSPDGGCTDAICRDITLARQTVHVQAAQFTSKPIGKALIAAKNRGVEVIVVTDKRKDDDDSQTPRLVGANVPVYNDGHHHTAHNKLIIIDRSIIYTGSFNLTKESESENAENLVRIEGKHKLVDAYEDNFKSHLSHSVALGK